MAGLSLAEAAYTHPASSGSVVRNVRRNTASCMYPAEEEIKWCEVRGKK